MHTPFDIMKIDIDESLVWVEATETFDEAKTRVWELMFGCPGEYIVYNQETKELLSLFSPKPVVSSFDLPDDMPSYAQEAETFLQPVPTEIM
jgi:hypothetical protein